MITYKYRFLSGNEDIAETTEVEVTQELKEVLESLDREEHNNYRRYQYRITKTLEKEGCSNPNYIKIASARLNHSNPVARELERKEQMEKLHSALDRLPHTQKSLLIEVYFMEVKAVDIAAREGLDKSTISRRLKRAKESLKKLYA